MERYAALLGGTVLAAGCSFDYTETGPSPGELLGAGAGDGVHRRNPHHRARRPHLLVPGGK